MTGSLQRLSESSGHRDPPGTAPFRNRHLPLSIRPLHMKLTLGEVDVGPLQRHHLSATQPSVPSQEHNQPLVAHRCLDQPFVLVEVMEVGFVWRNRE
ncbi:MAG TPA: hypothetical protein VLK65_22605 [Vicinamibacteria bacterium]|nr:hypothetical protein [Vicinamibacteria bacterium]